MNTIDLWNQKPLSFKRGQRIHINIGHGKPTKIYIIGVLDDDGEGVVAYRWWRKHKKYWHTEAKSEKELSYIIRLQKQGEAERKRREMATTGPASSSSAPSEGPQSCTV